MLYFQNPVLWICHIIFSQDTTVKEIETFQPIARHFQIFFSHSQTQQKKNHRLSEELGH